MIEGVTVYSLKTFPDERGFFREISRFKDTGFYVAQASHGLRYPGVNNGWHIHNKMSEVFYIPDGCARVVLKDCRTGSPTEVLWKHSPNNIVMHNFGLSSTPNEYMEIVAGEYNPVAIAIPHGVAHGYHIIQKTNVIYFASITYEESQFDEGRISPNNWTHHRWERETETV